MDTKRSYGWTRDLPDKRDLRFTPRFAYALPNNVDLSHYTLEIYDQGELGSCTANAGAALFEMLRSINKKPTYIPSRLYTYYNTRKIEGTIPYDAGGQLRDAIKSLSVDGCPVETMWPYDIDKFTNRPPSPVYSEGRKHQIMKYSRVNNTVITDVQNALALNCPVMAGFTVYESFESQEVAQTGLMTMPQPWEKVLGGHAVLIVGYCNDHQHFIVRNSWGADWGDRGFFYAPYAYFTNSQLSADFWTASVAN